MLTKSLATATLVAMTRLRLRGRPWSWLANGVAAFAAGALDPDDLREQVAKGWDIDDSGEPIEYELMAFEEYLVDRVLPPQSHVLIVGCGAGRDLIAYAHRGFHVDGIEPAPRAARAASQAMRDRGLPGTVLHGFAEDVTLTSSYDAIVFSYFCYGYIPTSERRVAALKKMKAHLNPGAAIVLSYNPRRTVMLTPLSRIGAALARSAWRPEAGDSVYLTGRSAAPIGVEHLFEDRELVAEAARAGFHAITHGDIAEARIATLKVLRS